jgi:hypothetical protein
VAQPEARVEPAPARRPRASHGALGSSRQNPARHEDPLAHIVTGIALCLTIIGIPLGIADFKMAGAALVPFGRKVVRARELNAGMVSADSTIAFPD